MPDLLMREFFDAIRPPGAFWKPRPGSDLDHLWDGISTNWQEIFDLLSELGDVRNPEATTFLEDLERDFGITPNPQLSVAQRIAILKTRMFTRGRKWSPSDMQLVLDASGFGSGGYGLTVIPNDPAVDPAQFLTGDWQTVCGSAEACCGYEVGGTWQAFCGAGPGIAELIVNGDVVQQLPQYFGCGDANICCGNAGAVCGYFETYSHQKRKAMSPPDSWTWPFVWFLAQSATFDGSGHVITLVPAIIPAQFRGALIEIILKKPLHSWCVLAADFI